MKISQKKLLANSSWRMHRLHNYSSLFFQGIMQIWRRNVKLGTGVFILVINFHFYAPTEQFLIKWVIMNVSALNLNSFSNRRFECVTGFSTWNAKLPKNSTQITKNFTKTPRAIRSKAAQPAPSVPICDIFMTSSTADQQWSSFLLNISQLTHWTSITLCKLISFKIQLK